MASPQTCNPQQLEAMLASDAAEEQFAELLQHVEQCALCQQHLETLAADAEHWRQATQVLSDFSSADEFRCQRSNDAYSRRSVDLPLEWTESMARQLLSPCSHPELLGRIGRYDVERLIGSGGMGIVFKAFDTELNRPVAIKILAPYLAGSGPARQRFAREAKAAAAVVHEHVVPIHNVETDGQSPYLVMRYVAGESLQARIDRLGPLDVPELLRIAMQTASGLAAAHAHGLIHRDIKPSNILVESSVERSLITDFGLARAADDASLTNTGYHPGTPQFMSPEQARGDSLDARSDLFSLGSVMYTMAAGRAPFRSETSYGVLRRITDTHPRDIQEINPEIPSWLGSVIGKLMEKSPSDRYQSAEELSEVLALCLAHVQRPASCRLPSDVVQLDARTKSKLRWQGSFRGGSWLLASGILVAAILCMAYWPNSEPFDSKDNLEETATAKASPPTAGNKLSGAPSFEADVGMSETVSPKPALRGPRKLSPPEPSDVMRNKLATSVTIQLEGATLRDGVAAILKDIDARFIVNEASLKSEEVDLQRTEAMSASGSAFVTLQRFLDRFQASFIVQESELEIVARQYAQSHPVTRYYELSLIQTGNHRLPNLVAAIELCGKPELWSSQGGLFTISRYDSMLIVKADEVTHHQIEQLLSQLNAWRVP